ncbi:MAG: DMT family transporter [bacterium]|nr:DMT family transporter [bacterium]
MRGGGAVPLGLTVGVLSISTAAVLIKLCEDAPPMIIAAWRLAIATLVLVPLAGGIRGRRLFELTRSQAPYLLLAGVFLGAHFFLWITSLKHTSVLSSVVIVTTNPIFIGIGSFFLFGERPSGRLIAAIGIALVGGVLIALSDAGAGAGSLRGDLLALGGAVMASCYFLVSRKVRQEVHILSYITPVYGVAAVVLVIGAVISGERFTGYQGSTYVYLVLLAIGPQLLGHGTLAWALRYVSATTVAVFVLGEPIGSSVLAYMVLEESVTPLQVAGGGLILAGIFLASRDPDTQQAAG